MATLTGLTSLAHLQIQTPNLVYTLWALPVLSLLALIVYRVFFHPLAKYPGPLLGKFTPFLPIWNMVRRTRLTWQYEMVQKYGSPVRVAHNELLFGDAKAWSDIYGQSSNPCLKEKKFYDAFTVTGTVSILNERKRTAHARIRRLVSHSFAVNNLLKQEDIILKKVRQLDQYVFAPVADKGGVVDIFGKMNEHYLDITSYLVFGESFDIVPGRGHITQNDMDQFMIVVPTQSFLPQLRYFPIKPIQDAYRGLAKLTTFAQVRVTKFMKDCESDPVFAKGTFLRNLVDAVDEETGTKLSAEELVENTLIFLTAGSDTTAITSMYTLWAVARNPRIYHRLTEAIRTAFPDPNVQPTFEQTSKIPYLQACIDETLRLYGPLSSGFPRVSPGRHISGEYVPEGTIVSTSAYITARDPTVFADPLEYIPERWLDATPEMRNSWRPFSYGPRNCIGKHLAEIGLNLTLARLYQLYDIKIDPSMTDDMMRPCDRGVTFPWGKKLLVIPAPVKR